MTKEELVQLLYDNFYNKELKTIVINGLDFTKYDCNVHIGGIKAPHDLYQADQVVGGTLYQDCQQVEGNVWQDNLKVKGHLSQYQQTVEGNLRQCKQRVKGDLAQHMQTVDGILYQGKQRVKGYIDQSYNRTLERIIEHPASEGHFVDNWPDEYEI